MVSEPDTVVRNVFDSQQSGATAVVTAEAHDRILDDPQPCKDTFLLIRGLANAIAAKQEYRGSPLGLKEGALMRDARSGSVRSTFSSPVRWAPGILLVLVGMALPDCATPFSLVDVVNPNAIRGVAEAQQSKAVAPWVFVQRRADQEEPIKEGILVPLQPQTRPNEDEPAAIPEDTRRGERDRSPHPASKGPTGATPRDAAQPEPPTPSKEPPDHGKRQPSPPPHEPGRGGPPPVFPWPLVALFAVVAVVLVTSAAFALRSRSSTTPRTRRDILQTTAVVRVG